MRKLSDNFPIVLVLAAVALLFLGQTIFENLFYAWIMAQLTKHIGVQEAQVIAAFSSIAAPLSGIILVGTGVAWYVRRELSRPETVTEVGITMRELQAQQNQAAALREHTEELRRQREVQQHDALIKKIMAPPEPLKIEIGNDDAFVTTKGYGISGIKRTYYLRAFNRDRTKQITNCKVTLVDIAPEPLRKTKPWFLSQIFSLASGEDIYIPIATFEEQRLPDFGPVPKERLVQVHSCDRGDWMLIEQKEHTLKIKATSSDSGYSELTCKIWVDDQGRFQIAKA